MPEQREESGRFYCAAYTRIHSRGSLPTIAVSQTPAERHTAERYAALEEHPVQTEVPVCTCRKDALKAAEARCSVPPRSYLIAEERATLAAMGLFGSGLGLGFLFDYPVMGYLIGTALMAVPFLRLWWMARRGDFRKRGK